MLASWDGGGYDGVVSVILDWWLCPWKRKRKLLRVSHVYGDGGVCEKFVVVLI